MFKKILKSFSIAVFVFIISNKALGQDNIENQIKIFIENVGNQIIAIANDKTINEAKKREKIIAEIDKIIDSQWIAKFVLGKSYKTLTENQKKDFLRLYREFMINTYGPKFKNYNGKKFTVNDIEKQNNFYIAHAEFIAKDSETPILTDFRVRVQDGKIYVLDFIAEGISLIETQRSEFNAIIDKDGVEKFLKNLEDKVKKLKTIKN